MLGENQDQTLEILKEITKALNSITEQIGLAGFYTRYNGEMSGGEGFVVSDGSEAMKLLTDDLQKRILYTCTQLKKALMLLKKLLTV